MENINFNSIINNFTISFKIAHILLSCNIEDKIIIFIVFIELFVCVRLEWRPTIANKYI